MEQVMNEPCRHLRTKKLYVSAQADEAWLLRSESETTAHVWCNCTQCETGPDDRAVTQAGCSDRTRPCFLE
jgi:hypothetical protein